MPQLHELNNAGLAEQLQLAPGDMERASARLAELWALDIDDAERLQLLLEWTELPERPDLGLVLASRVLELGPVERIAEIASIPGIGAIRLEGVIEALVRSSEPPPAEEPAQEQKSTENPMLSLSAEELQGKIRELEEQALELRRQMAELTAGMGDRLKMLTEGD